VEEQIKTKITQWFTPTRILTINKTLKTNIGKDVEKNSHDIARRNIK
jgi:hypothetical protein